MLYKIYLWVWDGLCKNNNYFFVNVMNKDDERKYFKIFACWKDSFAYQILSFVLVKILNRANTIVQQYLQICRLYNSQFFYDKKK